MEKLCSECKWQEVPFPPIGEGVRNNILCTHESNIPAHRHFVRVERSESGTCGPDGLWWEAIV